MNSSNDRTNIPYSSRVKVLIVDDTAIFRTLLLKIFEKDERFIVIGVASDGAEAIEKALRLKPDIITMDVLMPTMNGIEATSKILSNMDTRVVILSSLVDDPETNVAFEGLRAGALDVIPKPYHTSRAKFRQFELDFLNHLYALSKLPIHKPVMERATQRAHTHVSVLAAEHKPANIIAIGASTGGPNVLHQIFTALSPDIAVPIVVAQHIGQGFVAQLVKWLSHSLHFEIRVPKDGEKLRDGTIYISPDNKHLTVDGPVAHLIDEPPMNGYKPSVDKLFYSVAKTYGEEAVGVLLTGMGNDGAKGLRYMFERGAYTIAQDEATSVVFGMPKAAIEANAAMWVLSVHDIPYMLERICRRKEDGNKTTH